MKNEAVKFYEGEFSALSNFSSHKVKYKGVIYSTAEHAYQCQKFDNKILQQKIQNAPSAFLAREYGQAIKGRKRIFDKVTTMREIMRSKLIQHKEIQALLLKTGTKKILKNHPLDNFWGTGKSGKGTNVMGKIWMELRKEFTQKVK